MRLANFNSKMQAIPTNEDFLNKNTENVHNQFSERCFGGGKKRLKIIHKFVKRIEIGKNEVTIEWLVDEDHYKTELALTANSPLYRENQKIFGVSGSQSLINGAP